MNPLFKTILVLLLAEFVMLNVYTHNFIASYIAVRAKRERGVLVQIMGKNGWKFKPATLIEDHVRYKVSRKEKAMVPVRHAEFRRMLGVATFMHREGTDEVIDAEWNGVKGGDPQDTDNLYVRALHKPQISSREDMLMIIALVLLLGVSIYIAYTVTQQGDMIKALQAAQTASTTISGGNI